MWILPKNLIISPFVQDTGALILDLQEFCQTCEPSLTVRSNFTQSKTLLTKWKKESLRPLLYGRTLKHSHSTNFVDAWTSYLAVSHVNLFQVPDEETATQTPATYSHSSNKESLSQDLPLFSWKMFEDLSAQSSNQTNGQTPKKHPYCFMSLEKWKESVTSAIGAYSLREKQASPILGNESLSWEKEQILKLLGLKSFPDTFFTPVKASSAHATGIEHVYANQNLSMSRADMGMTTQPFYYKRLLHQLLALKESNPQAFARLAVETENNNSTNLLEPLVKTWATPMESIASRSIYPLQMDTLNKRLEENRQLDLGMQVHIETMTQKHWQTPTKSDALDVNMITPIKEHQIFDRENAKVSRQVHLATMNDQVRTWATPAKRDHYDATYTPKTLMNRLDKGHQDSIAMQALRSDTNKDSMNWATPQKRDFKQIAYSPEALATYIQNGHQESMPIQALRSNKLTFTELRTMREQALAKPESERTQEEINLLNYREMLNPRWVEMLMGLPIGWTMKNCVQVIQVSWMK